MGILAQEIRADGTMKRHGDVFSRSGKYTYDNGVLTFTTESYGIKEVTTYKFSHHDQYRLKLEDISEHSTITYLITKRDD